MSEFAKLRETLQSLSKDGDLVLGEPIIAVILRALAIAEVGEEVERAESDGLRGLVAEGLKLSHERVAALGEMLSASESKLSAALIAAEARTEQLRDVLQDCVMVMDEIGPDNWQPDFSMAWSAALQDARAALSKLKQAREVKP